MLINGATINGAPINGSSSTPVVEPEYVVRGIGYRWRLRVIVGGVDMTAQLTDRADIDREEGAAGVGSIALYLPPGPVVPTDWIGRAVTIDYISTTSGITTEERRFTGQIVSPIWNPLTRVMACELSDQLQQRVEALTTAAIDTLCGGYWSADVFEPVDGRSHWDYAQERLSTRPFSLDSSPSGELRSHSWYATAPHFVFGAGTTLDQSMSLKLAQLGNITNRIEIEFSYRYSRLWQRNQQYTWQHPQTGGSVGAGGFCNWQHAGGSEVPTIEMIEDATSGNGQTLINASYYLVPLTVSGGQNAGSVCDPEFIWINSFDTLLLGANWTGARRWVQTVTETYNLALYTPAGEAEATRVVQRAGYSFEVEDDAAEAWTTETIPNGSDDDVTDLDVEARRAAAVNVALRIGQTQLIAANRAAVLSWSVPTSMALGIDLGHTLQLDDQGVQGLGSCVRVVDNFDFSAGTAITTLSIAVMRGGGVTDPLTLPPRLGVGVTPTPDSGAGVGLPTQISEFGGEPYDDLLPGFAGNADGGGGPEVFPRRFDAPVDEIPASERDENKLTGEYLYRVGIPNDTLEL